MKEPPPPPYVMLVRFIATGREMTRRREFPEIHYGDGAAAAAWLGRVVPVFRSASKDRQREGMRPPLAPRFIHRRRRRKQHENRMARQKIRRQDRPTYEAPEHPEDYREKMYRIAVTSNPIDWATLRALGVIDEIPEP